MSKNKTRKFKLPASAVVALSFLVMILFGTAMLTLPFATRSGKIDFMNAFFTATSATCVTGLIVQDTFSYWSGFGQAIILLLIQFGGLGFITFVSLFTLYSKHHATLSQRKIAMQSAGSVELSGIRGLLKIILIGTFAFEFVGAFALSFAFVPVYGWGEGIWQAVFTSVSAFCNAGFTITGVVEGKSSLMAFVGNPLVTLVVSLLIIVGGIGFFVWGDVVHHGVFIKKYSLHSKIVLATTSALILIGWVLFAVFEWNNPATIGGEGAGTKILASLFLSVTPRTAGFNSVDYSSVTEATSALTIVYMFIGGSPGSTAGGIKTVTIAVFFLSFVANAKRYDEIHLYKRRFEGEASQQASSVICVYLFLAVISTILICALEVNNEAINLENTAFEVVSALGTVGLSKGITDSLCVFSKLVLIFLMFFGRAGGFTLILIFAGDKKPVAISRVAEKMIIG
ncbi:MAG: TrkH family potassium uptake protein [Candidatus Coproplasma sp.]